MSRTFASAYQTSMRSNINKSFVWLWMGALLSASIGISVQQVYCYCVGKTTVSLFLSEDVCHAPSVEPSSCCSSKPVQSKSDCCKKPSQEKKGCTKKSTKVYQLKTDSELANSAIKKLDAPKFYLPAPAIFFEVPLVPNHQRIAAHQFDRPPPVLSGRMKCVRYGVFRC